jgi:ATP-dependent Clp protease ATP-binding subunit ClpC
LRRYLQDVTDRFKDRLVDEGFNPTYGARPLRRAVMRLLEDNLAEKMLNGDIGEGSSCIMDVNADGEITVLTGDGATLSAGMVRGESGIA